MQALSLQGGSSVLSNVTYPEPETIHRQLFPLGYRQRFTHTSIEVEVFSPLSCAAIVGGTGAGIGQAAVEQARMQAREKCRKNLKMLYLGMQLYYQDWRRLPPNLAALYPEYVEDARVFQAPGLFDMGGQAPAAVEADALKIDFTYVPGLNLRTVRKTVVAYDSPPDRYGSGRFVLMADGNVQYVQDEAYCDRLLEEPMQGKE
jgi:hypothetical protein